MRVNTVQRSQQSPSTFGQRFASAKQTCSSVICTSMRLACVGHLPHVVSRPLLANTQLSPHRARTRCCAAADLAKFANKSYLDKAAKRFRLGEDPNKK